ncbi:MAG: D-alanyl-D-alanine carboxypeptidase [Bacteroidales bacterium]|nr:D-alanyl-D-alanine carboxypeptidase [Bacteroidales bacterium]
MIEIRHTTTFLAALLAVALPLYAGGPLQGRVEAAIAAEKSLSGASVAVCAITSEGEMIASVNENTAMVPASNLKLVSTGLALDRLGGDYRFGTTLGYSGPVRGGVLEGDLYIIGGADPTLGSSDTIASPLKQVFGAWKKMLDDAGIQSIEGRIIGDGRFIDGPREEQSWLWEDIGTYYGTGMSGLGFAENTLTFRVSPGATVGDSLKITQRFPMSPWLSIDYDCSTGLKSTGDQLYLFTTDFATDAVLRGTFALDKPTKDVLCSNKYPELTCAMEFSNFLKDNNIPNEGPGYVAGKTARLWTPGEGFRSFEPAGEMTLLGSTLSPALRKIARKTNYESNNFCAETLLRILGKEKTGNADYVSSRKAASRALLALGLGESSTHSVSLVDGSGLSRKNCVTASFFCRFLAAMMASPAYPDFFASIPALGSSKAVPADVASRVHRKTGSMNGVYCLSGYYTAEDGEVMVFSILINNSPVSTYSTRLAAERLLAAIVL